MGCSSKSEWMYNFLNTIDAYIFFFQDDPQVRFTLARAILQGKPILCLYHPRDDELIESLKLNRVLFLTLTSVNSSGQIKEFLKKIEYTYEKEKIATRGYTAN